MNHHYIKTFSVYLWRNWLNFNLSNKLLSLSILSCSLALVFYVASNVLYIGIEACIFFFISSIILYFWYLKSLGHLHLDYFSGFRNTIVTNGNYNEKVLGDVINIQGNTINFSDQNFPEFTVKISEIIEVLQGQGENLEQIRKTLVKDLSLASLRNPRFKRKFTTWKSTLNSDNVQNLDPYVLSIITDTPTLPSWFPLDKQSVIDTDIYFNLETFLREGRWEDADNETCEVLKLILIKTKGEKFALELDRRIGKLKSGSYFPYSLTGCNVDGLSAEDIIVIPGDHLKYLDRMWVKYSRGRFGFSVQKSILTEILDQNNIFISNNIYGDNVETFGEKIGFIKDGKWIYYTDIEYSMKQPIGHLPAKFLISGSRYFDGKITICEEILEVLYGRQYK